MNLDELIVKWFRGQASTMETQILLAAKYLRITNKEYGHIAATIKGVRAAHKTLGIREAS